MFGSLGSIEPWYGENVAAQTAVAQPKTNFWDTINKGLNVLQSGANVYTTVKSGTAPAPVYTSPNTAPTQTNTLPQPPAAQQTGMNPVLKYGLIATGATLLVYGIYKVATRKKKS